MNYNVNMIIEVDPEVGWLESDRANNLECVMDLIKSLVYDVDDVKIKHIEVEENE